MKKTRRKPTAATTQRTRSFGLEKRVMLLVAAWVVLVTGFALVGWNRIAVTRDSAYRWIDARHLHTPSWNPLKLPARWDSEWYLGIARNGYSYAGPESMSNIVFFPVYPTLVRLVGLFQPEWFICSGWLVSVAALIAACVVLARLVRDFHPNVEPLDAIFFLLIFPTAIFLNAVYTESLFLLLSVAAIYAARKKAFVWACGFAAVAALTRVTGVLLVLPLAVEYVMAYRKKGMLQTKLFAFMLPVAAAASFFVFHALRFGDAMAFFKMQANWGRAVGAINWDHVTWTTGAAQANLALDIGFFLLALVATLLVFRAVRLSYGLYMLATIAVAVSSGTLMSMGRYILVLFPLHILLAGQRPLVRRVWTIVSLLLFALSTIQFAHSYWTG